MMHIGRHHQSEGGRVSPQKKRFIEKNKQISALFEQFKEGQYSLSNFLDAITYQTTCAYVVFIFSIKKLS